MKAILNRDIVEYEQIKTLNENRGFKYGDGLFETIAVIRGEAVLIDRHIKRITEGADVLGIKAPAWLSSKAIAEQIAILAMHENESRHAIARIHLWRTGNGRYAPQENTAEVMLTYEPAEFTRSRTAKEAGFANSIQNFQTTISRFKTMSALRYVVAGKEQNERKLDEIILLDHRGNVSEALSSNIFWYDGSDYHTPPISTGCIEGVMRSWLIEQLIENGIKVQETNATKYDILQAKHLFTSNAVGVCHIESVEGVNYVIDERVQSIVEKLFW